MENKKIEIRIVSSETVFFRKTIEHLIEFNEKEIVVFEHISYSNSEEGERDFIIEDEQNLTEEEKELLEENISSIIDEETEELEIGEQEPENYSEFDKFDEEKDEILNKQKNDI